MRFNKTVTMTFLVLVGASLLCGCGSAPLTTKVVDTEGFSKSNSVNILDFSAKDSLVRYSGNADSLGHVMATLLQKELQRKSSNLAVYLESGNPITTDLVLEGRFKEIDEGDAAARVMIGIEGVTVAVEGKVKKPDGTIVAEFSKSKTSSGGPLGMGGLLAGDSDVIIEDIMEEIAEDLADFIIMNIGKR